MTGTKPYDSADYLDSEDAVVAYLAAASDAGDAALYRHALDVAARARDRLSALDAAQSPLPAVRGEGSADPVVG